MNLSPEFSRLREQAIGLRRAGKSRREIKAILSIASNQTLGDALRGEPPPEWTRRPNAKDEVRAQARELRRQGLDYEAIAARLGVSKSSVSLWVRDLPTPARLSYEECRKRSVEGTRRYWEAERPVREAARAAVRDAAAAGIGPLTDREIIIAGAIAYWCEGAKSKPYRRNDRIVFTNSDPSLIAFFLRFLSAAGISLDRVTFRVCIHESADIAAAQQYWLRTTGARSGQFRSTTLKRHNPKTARRNVGPEYHGCLRIEVAHGGDLYRKIAGWVEGITSGTKTT
jgi:transcriptional regulator with XRE-family HTH domain